MENNNLITPIFSDDNTLDEILGVFDSDEMKEKEYSATEISFLKASAALAIEAKYGLRAQALHQLSEKVGLEFNTLAQYSTVARRIPPELWDKRITFSIYRKCSEAGSPIAAQKLAKWCIDSQNSETFNYAHFKRKQTLIKELVKNDGSDEEMDKVIENFIPEDFKPEQLHHDYIAFPLVFTDPSQLEDAMVEIYDRLMAKWLELKSSGKQINLRVKVNGDYWES